MRKLEYTLLLAVGIICPPPRKIASLASSTLVILNLALRIGSSHKGPSRVPQLKPCRIPSRTERRVFWSTSEDVAGGEEVVAVVLGEEGADFSYGVLDGDFAGFNVLGDTVVQRFGDHGDLVLLVWDKTRPNALKLLASEVLKSLLRSAYLGGQARAKELGADQTQKLLRITLELTWLQLNT
ncbi:hypothetical protein KC323_g100 [Hortaea werneckii]|nr:hypothetical protein KC323_g100 [Hortaea werneckii]